MNALKHISVCLLVCSLVILWQSPDLLAQQNSGAAKTLGAPLSAPYSPRLAAQTGAGRPSPQQQATTAPAVTQRDGSHDFDFLIGDWKAHVRVLRKRLDGSNNRKDWVEYDGISNHKKLLDSNANFEEFDAYCAQLQKRNKGQTLRLYNPGPINGRSIWLTWTRELSASLPSPDNSLTTAASSIARILIKAERFTCAMCG